ncbi:MAG: SDR family oxidoreductase, partial [Balneolaceae bacterium]
MQKLKGKTAVITGSTRGIGRAIAELFADEGAVIVVVGRDKSAGNDVVKTIEQRGGVAVFVQTDICSNEENKRLVEFAVKEFGSIDILVPNAGILGLGSILDVDLETWNRTLDTNLNSILYLMREAIPVMLNNNSGGSIVVTGSIAAHKGFPNHAAYCASKGAVEALVRQTAVDYAPEIRINLLQPGPVDTELYRSSAIAFPDSETILDEVPGTVPMKRVGTPADIAKAALFLASEDS